MATWHLTELRAALERKGWRLISVLPGDDYAISATWELQRAGDSHVLRLDFEGMDDLRALPLEESYACRARGTNLSLYFRRRGTSGSKQRGRWTGELSAFVEAIGNATV